jgi:predicted component of type VI protein secretion system
VPAANRAKSERGRTPTSPEAYLLDERLRIAVPVAGRRVRIGRAGVCEILVPDATVSRIHAELRPYGTGYVLRATGASGTRVNGALAPRDRSVAHGDVIEVGPRRLRFIVGRADAGFRRVDRESSTGNVASEARTIIFHAPGEERTAAPLDRGRRRHVVAILTALAALALAAMLLLRR